MRHWIHGPLGRLHGQLPHDEETNVVFFRGPPGGELAVFVTEPCNAKAHGPWFAYYRGGHLRTGFSFEALGDRVGEDPDVLLPALVAAGLVGPHAQHGTEDFEERIVRAITEALSLPELELP
ncbi:hypothetical protein ACFQ77_17495 [Streptomyces virginiae]|uniref:hypothetical protein n=1 Tax=Streptomyces virginiae TaxID=1961 RepID=UPI00369F48C2